MNFQSSENNLVYLCLMQKEDITQPKAIDLALPSGTLWADRNLGAESVTDYGDYYMWGSTEPDTGKICNWKYAPFNCGFKWCNPDILEVFRNEAFPNGVLSDQYDAAHVHLGGNWHMPTKEQFKELIDNTTSAWVYDYQGSGIKGRTFTSKKDSFKSIFIPATGNRNGLTVLSVGSGAYLWSSTLNSGGPYDAYNLYFNSIHCDVYNLYRSFGYCVRPVSVRL